MLFSIFISCAGIGLAYLIYILNIKIIPVERMPRLHSLLLNKYYIDEFYEKVFVQPFLWVCRTAFKIDANVVDDLVNGAARVVAFFSEALRPLQTGLVQNYILVQIIGTIILILTLGKIWFQF